MTYAIYSVKNYHPAHAGVLRALKTSGYEPVLCVAREKASTIKSGNDLFSTEAIFISPGPLSQLVLGDDSKRLYQWGFPRVMTVWRLFQRFRPEIVLVYEKGIRSSLIAGMAKLFRASVVQVLDSPGNPFDRSRAWKWPLLWIVHLLNPKRRVHSGKWGQSLGDVMTFGPMLGESTFAPYPVFVDQSDAYVRVLHTPLRIVVFSGSNRKNQRTLEVLKSLEPQLCSGTVDVTVVVWPSVDGSVAREEKLFCSQVEAGNLSFREGVETGELHRFLRAADVVIYASAKSSYGHAVSVALACGIPVICDPRIGARTLIKHGVNGFLCSVDESDEVSELIEWLIMNPKQHRILSTNALQQAKQTLSESAWFSVIESLRRPLRND